MSDLEQRARALFERWVERQESQGSSYDPEELCRETPELLEALRERIRIYRELEGVLASPSKIPAGTVLGHYEVLQRIGAGGMGEVYRARDTRLGREVAVKVLPEHLRGDTQVRRRFEHEARAISQLSHPNICTLYDVGSEAGVDFLVLEVLEGETLAQRLERGALPIVELMEIGAQIAEAIDAAHRQGLVHRDLKPGNVMLTKACAKVLDFGLAKERIPPPGLSTESPTLSSPLTRQGAMVGTTPYMAPEQLQGGAVDGRSDIFALGVVLYEMATGERPFRGESRLSLVAAILEREPAPVRELRPVAPEQLEWVIGRCLHKDPEERWQSARDVALELRRPVAAVGGEAAPAPRRRLQVAVAVLLLALGAALAALLLPLRSDDAVPAAREVRRYPVALPNPPTEQVAIGAGFVVSDDGTKIAYQAGRYLRIWDLQRLEPASVSITGTGIPSYEFPLSFSPDGEWIAYYSQMDGKLFRVATTGGTPIELATEIADQWGGDWAEDGTIVYSANTPRGTRLYRISEDGGESEVVTTGPEGEEHVGPHVLPDGRGILFSRRTAASEYFEIAALDLRSGESHTVVDRGYLPKLTSSGHLVFVRPGTRGAGTWDRRFLFAAPFDLATLRLRGSALPVAEGAPVVRGARSYDVSDAGQLVYAPAEQKGEWSNRLVFVDRAGGRTPTGCGPGRYWELRVSPDDRYIAYSSGRAGAGFQLWLCDLTTGRVWRLSESGSAGELNPLWDVDGQRIFYRSVEGGTESIRVRSLGQDEPSEPILRGQTQNTPYALSADGRHLFFVQWATEGVSDIWVMELGGAEPEALLATPASEEDPSLSPDDRWLAYHYAEGGDPEVFVQRFPEGGRAITISAGAGANPRWSRDGRELYFWKPAEEGGGWFLGGGTYRMMVVAVPVDEGAAWPAPRELFTCERSPIAYQAWDVMGDGRFVMVEELEWPETVELVVVENWVEELNRKVPVD